MHMIATMAGPTSLEIKDNNLCNCGPLLPTFVTDILLLANKISTIILNYTHVLKRTNTNYFR